ncbi:MAG: hypothetical protein R3212_05720 [Xanthomonadales bacterium]|nr:hypothetical protein [Xanthomonadales bacterium]
MNRVALAMFDMQRKGSSTRFYLAAAVILLAITLLGFSATYFAPLFGRATAFGGRVGNLPLIVHVHGWSFFLWYLLLIAQTILVRSRSTQAHRRMGISSVVLAAVMVFSGIVTIAFNIHLTMENQGPPIWRTGGIAIFATLVLFVWFYTLAIRNRGRAEYHKRLMLMAGVPALGAAVGRILLVAFAPLPMNIPAAILLTNLLIVAAMAHDKLAHGRVHPAYRSGLAICLLTELIALALPHTTAGKPVLELFSSLGALVAVFYR